VADPELARAQQLAAKYQAQSYASLREMLEKAEIDALCVCTPPRIHADNAVEAMQAGKHVMVEKPADITPLAIERMIAVQKATGLKAAVISQHRFDPSASMVKKAIEAGRFGRLTRAAAQVIWWRPQAYFEDAPWRGSMAESGGGALISQSIHTLDLMLWMMGEVDELYAYSGILAHHSIEVEDTCVAVLKFKSGALGVLEASIASYPGLSARLEVSGDRGSAIIDADALRYFHAALPGEQTGLYGVGGDSNRVQAELNRYGLESTRSTSPDPAHFGNAHQEQLRDFAEAILQDRKPQSSLEEGCYTVRVILAVHESASTGKPVKVGAP
jgi:predicted dehydrogenase